MQNVHVIAATASNKDALYTDRVQSPTSSWAQWYRASVRRFYMLLAILTYLLWMPPTRTTAWAGSNVNISSSHTARSSADKTGRIYDNTGKHFLNVCSAPTTQWPITVNVSLLHTHVFRESRCGLWARKCEHCAILGTAGRQGGRGVSRVGVTCARWAHVTSSIGRGNEWT